MEHLPPTWSRTLDDGRTAYLIATERRHGDLAVGQDADIVERRRRSIVDAPWAWFRQVHGAHVVTVTEPGLGAGTEADAAVTRLGDAPLAVQIADCAPVALVDDRGVIGVAHAGWRGLVGGVLEATVGAMARLGATAPVAVLGPCIRPAAYEFGAADLDAVVAALGPSVRGRTADGRPALDMPAAVRAVLDGLGVEVVADVGSCTAADADRRWSHRARTERERQAVVVWIGGP